MTKHRPWSKFQELRTPRDYFEESLFIDYITRIVNTWPPIGCKVWVDTMPRKSEGEWSLPFGIYEEADTSDIPPSFDPIKLGSPQHLEQTVAMAHGSISIDERDGRPAIYWQLDDGQSGNADYPPRNRWIGDTSPEAIKLLRERLGLSGQAFADRLNRLTTTPMSLNRNTVSRWERGEYAPGTRARWAIRELAKQVHGRD